MKSLENQFLFDLADIYDAEHRIAKALPMLTKAGTSEELKKAILSRAKEAEGHLTKVEQIFECFGQKAGGRTFQGTAGRLAVADEMVSEFGGSLASAEALVSALQMVDYQGIASYGSQREWEIASYGCLHEWANLLGSAEAATLLEEILEDDRNDNPSFNGPARIGGDDEPHQPDDDDILYFDFAKAMQRCL